MYIFRRSVLDAIDEGIELFFFDIGKMIMFYDMDSDIEELEPYTERGETEVCRLYEYDDGTLRKSEEFSFDRFQLWVRFF